MDPADEWYVATANIDGQNGRIAFQSSTNLTSMVKTKSAGEASLHILSFVLTEEYCTQAEARSFWETVARYAREQQRTSLVMVINPFETSRNLCPDQELPIVRVPGFNLPRVGSQKKWFVEFFLVNMPGTDQVLMQTFVGRDSSEFREWLGRDAYNYLLDFDQEYQVARELWDDRER